MTKFEYVVCGEYEDGVASTEIVYNRNAARQLKKEFKEVYNCVGAKILQRKYVLETERTVR